MKTTVDRRGQTVIPATLRRRLKIRAGATLQWMLVDDLYRSGATATVVAQGLLENGAAAVFMLAMTKTRTRT